MIRLEETQPELMDQDILDFETTLDVKLPQSFVQQIKSSNGGYPIETLYYKGYEIDEFYSIKYGENTIEEQLRLLKDFFDNNSSIPFADSNGGIIYIDALDSNKISIRYSDGQTDFLANSFKEFMNGLKNEPYDF